MKKKLFAAALVMFSMTTAFPAYAAGWQKDPSGWRWQRDDETFVTNGWEWLDGNQDQIAECYYFDQYGYMMRNTQTPDGHQVNPDGSWVVDGVVQSRNVGANGNEAGNAGTLTDHSYSNEWLGYRLELLAPAKFAYKDKNEDLLTVRVSPLGEALTAATVDMGFMKKQDGWNLENYVDYYVNLLRTAGYGDVKTEAGAVLGDGNTYTAISGKTVEGTGREYYIRISGDYLILFTADYADGYKEAAASVMAAVKPPSTITARSVHKSPPSIIQGRQE